MVASISGCGIEGQYQAPSICAKPCDGDIITQLVNLVVIDRPVAEGSNWELNPGLAFE